MIHNNNNNNNNNKVRLSAVRIQETEYQLRDRQTDTESFIYSRTSSFTKLFYMKAVKIIYTNNCLKLLQHIYLVI